MKRLRVELSLSEDADYIFFLDKWEPLSKHWSTKFVTLSEDECIQKSRLWNKQARLRVRAVDLTPTIKDEMERNTIITANQDGEPVI